MELTARQEATKAWQPFPPIIVNVEEILLPTDFSSQCRDWVMNNGEYDELGKFYTSFNKDTLWVKKNNGDLANPKGESPPDFINAVLAKVILPDFVFREVWIQSYDPSGFHSMHNHDDDKNYLSGCLYLDQGDSSIFQNPLEPNYNSSIPVNAGTLLYWHPALYHSSFPSLETRTIIAFNICEKC